LLYLHSIQHLSFGLQLIVEGAPDVADVKYFFRLHFGNIIHSLAVVSVFSPPDKGLLEESHRAAYICHHLGAAALRVVDVKAITSVVSMVPDYQVMPEGDIVIPENQFSLVDVPLQKLASLCGTLSEGDDDNGNEDDDDDKD
jgi:hypothetical protein